MFAGLEKGKPGPRPRVTSDDQKQFKGETIKQFVSLDQGFRMGGLTVLARPMIRKATE